MWPSEWLALAAGLISLLALVGYAYQVRPLQGTELFLPMALNTAFGFLLIATGLLALRPRRGLVGLVTGRDAAAATARQWSCWCRRAGSD